MIDTHSKIKHRLIETEAIKAVIYNVLHSRLLSCAIRIKVSALFLGINLE